MAANLHSVFRSRSSQLVSMLPKAIINVLNIFGTKFKWK